MRLTWPGASFCPRPRVLVEPSRVVLPTVRAAGFQALVGVTTADDKKPVPRLEEAIVSGEKDGKLIPKGRTKECVVTFKGDKVYGTDKDRKTFLGDVHFEFDGYPTGIIIDGRHAETRGDRVRGD